MSLTNLNKSPNESVDEDSANPSSMLRISLALVAILLITTAALLVPLPSGGGRTMPAIGDMVHAPLFGFLTLVTYVAWSRMVPIKQKEFLRPVMSRALICGACVFAFGVASEFVQAVSGRSAAVHDAFANSTGIFAVVCGIITYAMYKFGELSGMAMRLVICLAFIPVAFSWWRPLATIYDVYQCNQEFPLLSSFERSAELERWHFAGAEGQRAKQHADHGDYSLKAEYFPGSRATTTLFDFHRDWSSMERLTATVTLSEKHLAESVRIALKVVDDNHQKDGSGTHLRVWTLNCGETKTVEISCDDLLDPTGNPLEIRRIRYLNVQLIRPELATTVFIDNIRLIPKLPD